MSIAAGPDAFGGVKRACLLLLLLASVGCAWAWELKLPPRPANAPSGKEMARRLAELPIVEREDAVIAEVVRGNVPTWWRRFAEVAVGPAMLHVAPDYLVIGSDEDFLRMPLSPTAAQAIADQLECTLPTTKMVDVIFRAAPLKIEPQPLPPGPEMTTVAQFARHSELVEASRRAARGQHPDGVLVAGHKKDVVLSPQLAEVPDRVAIYGWQRSDGVPIQPLFLRHTRTWVDYSHGVRLVARDVGWGSGVRQIRELMRDDRWWTLFSDEGPFGPMRYGTIKPRVPVMAGEKWEARFFRAEVRALIGRPEATDPAAPVQLVVYAVPAGNTIEQTLGRRLRADDDWHFDIQHIAAQTRWLRAHGHPNLVLAVIEPLGKSWVTWTREMRNSGAIFGGVLDELRQAVPGARITLASHSAGGSAIFSLLDDSERVPDDVERIVLLDSNYRYDGSRGHAAKLATWLRGAADRVLFVAAYEDFRARLDGKAFVSEAGGTWGRSQMMLADLSGALDGFVRREDQGPLEDYRSKDGRAIFLLRRNPEAMIWHTRLVELNGFIHAMFAGTADEGRDYRYLGQRVYAEFCAP